MPPYASTYTPPAFAPPSNPYEPPIIITLALDGREQHSQMMDIDDDTEDEVMVKQALEDVRKELKGKSDEYGEIKELLVDVERMGSRTDQGRLMIVLDTNVLIRHLPILRELVNSLELAAQHNIPSAAPTILIPTIVVQELDGLKSQRRVTSDGKELSQLARAATSFLLESLEARQFQASPSFLQVQRPNETKIPPGQSSKKDVGSNDDLVLDAAEFHRPNSVLLTDDKILLVKTHSFNIPAYSIDRSKVKNARQLLELFVPRLAEALPDSSTSPVTSAPVSAPSNPRRTKSVPSKTSAPSTPTRKVVPIPLTASPPRVSEDLMELESEYPPPPRVRPHLPPRPRPIVRPSDVFYNMIDIVAHFLAYDLYWHVSDCLEVKRPKEKHEWFEELGDWRQWDGAECIEVLKKWWDEGELREVVLKGLRMDAGESVEEGQKTQRTVGIVVEEQAMEAPPPRSQAKTIADVSTSRWANEWANEPNPTPIPAPTTRSTPISNSRSATGSNSTPLGSTRQHSSNGTASTPTATSLKDTANRVSVPPLPLTKRKYSTTPLQRLQTFHQSLARFLPGGHTSLRSDPDMIDRWPSWRWELLFEGMQEVLAIILSSLLGDVRKEVRAEVESWVKDLKLVGVEASI